MTEDASPENLRKFLKSDDPALVRMGLSMAKGSGVPEELLGLVAGLYMWHDDKGVRAAAKSSFMKHAPDELKDILKGTWNTSYRTIKTGILQPKVETMLPDFKDTLLDTMDVWKSALVRTSGDRVSIVRIIDGFGAEAVELLIKTLRDNRESSVREAAAEALGEIGDTRAVEPLTKVLEDDNNYRICYFAAEALGKIGDTQAVEPLIGVLSDDTGEWVRRGVAEALGKIGKPVVERLIGMLSDDSQVVRRSAAEALGMIGDKRAVESLIGMLSNDRAECNYHWRPSQEPHPRGRWVRREVAGALDSLGWVPETDGQRAAYLIAVEDWKSLVELGEPAVETLIKALGALGDEDVLDALGALGEIGDSRAVESLIEVLSGDRGWGVRQSATEALGKIGDEQAVEPLIKALRGKENMLRWCAADALGEIGEPAVELLIEVLGDNNNVEGGLHMGKVTGKSIESDVRDAAKRALKKLGHKVK